MDGRTQPFQRFSCCKHFSWMLACHYCQSSITSQKSQISNIIPKEMKQTPKYTPAQIPVTSAVVYKQSALEYGEAREIIFFNVSLRFTDFWKQDKKQLGDWGRLSLNINYVGPLNRYSRYNSFRYIFICVLYFHSKSLKKQKDMNVPTIQCLSIKYLGNYILAFLLDKCYLGTKIKSALHFHIFYQSQGLILILMVVCYTSYLKIEHLLYKTYSLI